MKFSAFAPLFFVAFASATSPDDLTTLAFTTTWKSAKKSPNKSTAQMCAMKTFHAAHENMHDLYYALEDAWVVSDASFPSSKMEFKGIVSSSQHHGGSCGPLCKPDDDELVAELAVTLGKPAELTQHHGGSCGPLCKPDDDELVEDPIVITLDKPAELTQHLRSSQHHGGSCGPLCKPDDDELAEDPIVCDFCPANGQVDVSTLSRDDLIRLAAHMDWEKGFCDCLETEDPEGAVMGCAIVISGIDGGAHVKIG